VLYNKVLNEVCPRLRANHGRFFIADGRAYRGTRSRFEFSEAILDATVPAIEEGTCTLVLDGGLRDRSPLVRIKHGNRQLTRAWDRESSQK
jgi:hypothetical protein